MTNKEYISSLNSKDFALVVDDIMFQCLRNVLLLKHSNLDADKKRYVMIQEAAREAGFTDMDNLGIFEFYKWLEEEYNESN